MMLGVRQGGLGKAQPPARRFAKAIDQGGGGKNEPQALDGLRLGHCADVPGQPPGQDFVARQQPQGADRGEEKGQWSPTVALIPRILSLEGVAPLPAPSQPLPSATTISRSYVTPGH
jgi:hypothetical protein